MLAVAVAAVIGSVTETIFFLVWLTVILWFTVVESARVFVPETLMTALTELAEGSGGWGGFVRSEGEEAIRQENPGALPRVDVSGGNHDICDCGSRVWCDNGPTAKQTCFRCGKERPE